MLFKDGMWITYDWKEYMTECKRDSEIWSAKFNEVGLDVTIRKEDAAKIASRTLREYRAKNPFPSYVVTPA